MATIINAAAEFVKVVSASEMVKKGLHSVRVSKIDADEVQRQLEGELFETWNEKLESMQCTRVPTEKIPAFLTHMKNTYDGIGEKERRKMEGVLFSRGAWEHRLIEWKINSGTANSGARYGMIAFGRSADGKEVDCMYIFYKMNFKIKPRKIVNQKEHHLLFGLVNWTTDCEEEEENAFRFNSVKMMKNFFRLKALQGFYKEGMIDKISYVKSIDDVPNE